MSDMPIDAGTMGPCDWADMLEGFPESLNAAELAVCAAHLRRLSAEVSARDEQIEDLRGVVAEAMEWNWMDDGVPTSVVQMCQEACEPVSSRKEPE